MRNVIHAVYLDKDDLTYWKVKEVRRFAIEKLGLLCLENLNIMLLAMQQLLKIEGCIKNLNGL